MTVDDIRPLSHSSDVIVAVYDRKIGQYAAPLYYPTLNHCYTDFKRLFARHVARPVADVVPYVDFAPDFDLMYLGTYNRDTGELFTGGTPPCLLCSLVTFSVKEVPQCPVCIPASNSPAPSPSV